jgi:hypothetical protein
MLDAAAGSPGQYRFQADGNVPTYAARVTYTDGTQAIIGPQPVYSGSAPSGSPGLQFRSFGPPAMGRSSDGGLAYLAKYSSQDGSGRSNGVGIFTGTGELVATKGQPTPVGGETFFKSFLNPLCNSDAEVAFIAKLGGKGITAANDQAIFLRAHELDTGDRPLTLIGRAGEPAPGASGKAFSSFSAVALPDLPGTKRLYFTAKLAGRNETGLWARDSTGATRMLFLTGHQIQTGAGPKTLRAFTIFSSVAGSTSQARSFNDNGGLVYNAVFTDGTEAILSTQVP